MSLATSHFLFQLTCQSPEHKLKCLDSQPHSQGLSSMALISKALKLKQFKRQTWIDKLPPNRQRELLDLRAAHHDGQLKDKNGYTPSINQLYQLVVSEFGDILCHTSFSYWMADYGQPKVKS